MFPNASEDCIRLLKSMLQFDPYARLTTEDAMNDPYFNVIKEQGYITTAVEEHDVKNTFSPHSEGTDTSSSSNPPQEMLNPEKEKVQESPLHLKHNVSHPYQSNCNNVSSLFVIF